MKSNLKKIGNFIEIVDLRNNKLLVKKVRGVSINKKFIPTKANMKGVDISEYKIVEPRQFSFNPNTARMGNKIPIAFNDSKDNYLVSKIYPVFKVVDERELLPEYLMLWFKRKEFDRYARYHSWGSARETFDWDQMCDIEIPKPSINVQKNYVSIYKNLEVSQKSYENSFNDLQLITDTFLENLSKKKISKKLNEYIEEVDIRNSDLKNKNLRGISILKKFIKSKANQTNLNLDNCKIIEKESFGYVTVTSRNGNKISIALMKDEAAILSSTYIVFKIKNTKKLLPKFLLLWFKRKEFDRYARYHSWGSARETFDWVDLGNTEVPIPKIDIQESIIAIHDVLEKRKSLNEGIINIIDNFCPIAIIGASKY